MHNFLYNVIQTASTLENIEPESQGFAPLAGDPQVSDPAAHRNQESAPSTPLQLVQETALPFVTQPRIPESSSSLASEACNRGTQRNPPVDNTVMMLYFFR